MFDIKLSSDTVDAPLINEYDSNDELKYTTIKGIKVVDPRKFNKFLKSLFSSPTHSSIVKTKVDYVVSKHSLLSYGYAGKVEGEEIALNISKNDDLTDLLIKVSADHETYNAFSFQVIPTKDGSFGTIEYVDYSKLIFGVDGKIYYGSKLLPLEKYNKETNSGVFVWKSCALNLIPVPVYYSAFNSILSEIGIGEFYLSNISNGFSAGALINFVEEVLPSDDEMRKRAEAVRKKMVGQKNGGSVHLNWSTSKDNAPTIQQFSPNNLDKQYELLDKQTKNNIITAHQAVAGELFGVQKEGGVFDATHLKESYNIFANIYIKNRQRILMQSFNYIFGNFNLGVKLVLEVDDLFSTTTVGTPPDAYQLKIAGFTSEEMKEIFRKFYGL